MPQTHQGIVPARRSSPALRLAGQPWPEDAIVTVVSATRPLLPVNRVAHAAGTVTVTVTARASATGLSLQ